VRIKLAMSLDGRTALSDGESKWISSDAARADVQRWRARSSAILTGSGTALADDPKLTVRLADTECVPPLRVLLDRELRLPRSANLLADGAAPTLVFHADRIDAPADFAPHVDYCGARERDEGLDLVAVVAELARRGINELLVECGPRLAGALLRGGFVDELLLYQAPMLLGGDARPMLDTLGLQRLDQHARWRLIERRQVGVDQRLRLRPV
jgi:diaminohydroxyphosphoribosylaminopyrimidine deaminase/5-amino-6-(5-phosphoribosylamino)uracil reductase